jgi:hypothetical protein
MPDDANAPVDWGNFWLHWSLKMRDAGLRETGGSGVTSTLCIMKRTPHLRITSATQARGYTMDCVGGSDDQFSPAALRNVSALSVFSQGASMSVRPKCPYDAVAL